MNPGIVTLAVLLTSALVVTGCRADSGGDQSSTLRVACFGNDQRTQRVQAAAKAFEQANTGLHVQLECVGFASYFDKLATQFAAKDAPDVVMVSDQYLGEYADRGALKELGDSVDTSKFSELAAAEGRTAEGRFGIAAGLNTMTVFANTELFKAAGISVPDDATWTWDQYAETAAKLTAAAAKKTYGSDAPNFGAALELWLRQHGKSMYSDGGGLGFTSDDVTPFMEYLKKLGTDGAIPPASVVTELRKALEQSGVSTNKTAMGWFWNSSLAAVSKASGEKLTMLRPPSAAGSAKEAALYFKTDSLWSINARAKAPDTAAKFIDFMVNSPEAGKATLTSLGVPANSAVREAIAGQLKGSDKATLEYVDKIGGDLGPGRPAIPAGGGTLDATLNRHAMDVLFGRQGPQAAAAKFVDDMNAAIKK